MTDKPLETVISKPDAKNKEPQKFVYLQLQQERLDGSGRVTALVPGRGSSTPTHFIPLTAKLNSISVLGSGARPARATVPVPSPRQQAHGSTVVSVATPRPSVSSAISVASTRSLLTTTVSVSSSRPIIASPLPTLAPKPPLGTCAIRRASGNVVVSSGGSKPVMSPSAATITVLGSGNNHPGSNTTVFRPSNSQGNQPHGPVILHTSKVSSPASASTTVTKMSPRLLPIPISQVRAGVTNKAVLSYNAIMQAGGGEGGGGTSIVSKDNPSIHNPSVPSQPLLLQGASSPTSVKNPSLAKGGPATISIITGKGNKPSVMPGTSNTPLNMLSVNLGHNKPNMINLKIANGQIQTDGLQQMDVLREARPLSQGKQTEDWKENTLASHTLNTGTFTVTGPLCSTVTLPKSSEAELKVMKQTATLAALVDRTEEDLSEITRVPHFSTVEEKSSNYLQRGEELIEDDDYEREQRFESIQNQDTSESKIIADGNTFHSDTPVYHPSVSVSQTSSNKYQLATLSSPCMTTVYQQPIVSTHQIYTSVHHPVSSVLPQPVTNVHQSSSPRYLSSESQHGLSRESLDLDRDNDIEQSEGIDGSNIYEEVRKEVLGTLLSKPQDQFKCNSPVNVNNNNSDDKGNEIKEEKTQNGQIDPEDEKHLMKIKVEDTEEKTDILGSSGVPIISDDIKPELIKFTDLLKWEDGVGKLDGSGLKFRMNEFDAVEIVEDREVEEIKNHQSKKYDSAAPRHHARKPNFRELVKDEEIFSDNSQDSEPQGSKSARESDDICCCKNCGCYGLSSEFFRDSSFCSLACGDEHAAREIEWDKERLKQDKERQKRKRLKQEKLTDQETGVEGNGSDAEESTMASDEDSMSSKNTAMGSDVSIVSKSQYPWQDGKSNFSWTKYLEYCGRSKGLAKAAPLKLWTDPFPFTRNHFRPGMKLEAIDPSHQALFCVMTVAETVGFRLRLHFDGYSDQHDYWINADSQNLFPVGWCEKNGRQLEPPLGVIGFSWKAYLEHCKAQPAPRHAFVNKGHTTIVPPNNFRVGMKLEAEDRKNMWVCVATVADVLDNRVLIHFDGWDKAYDVWNEVSSPYIHPIGWCAANSIDLHPPNDYPNPESFNWHEYLQETNSMAVPARAFKTRPRREFRENMKLEAVDKRNPGLIRVATIVEIQDYQLKIHFDGWGDDYDYWVDDDSPDLHPPLWCNKSAHRLQTPLISEQQADFAEPGMSCGTIGCKGIGHVKGPIYTTHHTAFGCPYSLQNLNKDPDSVIPDRLHISSERKKGKLINKIRLDLRQNLEKKGSSHEQEESEGQKKRVRKRRKFFDELSPPEPNRAHKVPKMSIEDIKPHNVANLMQSPSVSDMHILPVTPSPSTSSQPPSNLLQLQPPLPLDEPTEQGVDMIVHQSVFNPGYNPHPVAPLPHSWERHRHLTAPLGDAKRTDVETWNADQVQQMVARIPGCEQVAHVFTSEQIDGEALLMMTQNDLVSLLHLKLGPAIKIMAVIMCLRSSL